MNKEQQELLDEVYKKYQTQTMFNTEDLVSLKELDGMDMSTGEIKKIYRQYAPKEFINKCKTDNDFSETWGLKIEERELSLKERYKLAGIKGHKEKLPGEPTYTEEQQHSLLDELVPTKLITITYKDKTIESYE